MLLSLSSDCIKIQSVARVIKVQDSNHDHQPKQERSLQTENKLLNALVGLLQEKSFNELTVSELAGAAGLTTGAIYRRFADKEDMLRVALKRNMQDRMALHEVTYPGDLTDRELLEDYLTNLMGYTLRNRHLLRAANQLNDTRSLQELAKGRAEVADYLAGRIRTSRLPEKVLKSRVRLILRIATSTFRDTFLAGRGAAKANDLESAEFDQRLERLCANLAEMAESYLELTEDSSGAD